jgi:tRNA (guanine37-N1)-methyltransferase
LREHGEGRHRVVDDAPFGGGPGMVLKPGPVASAIAEVRAEIGQGTIASDVPVVLLDPRGRRFNQGVADELSVEPELILVSGHYEGVDDRIRQSLVTDEISIGDFVLTGGELVAMVVIDAVARRLAGVLGGAESGQRDSFAEGLLQHPQYTRPAVFNGAEVPQILVSGDHARIAEWRRRQSLMQTVERRPDLLDTAEITSEERAWLDARWQTESDQKH